MKPHVWAYAAGIIDGEGTVGFTRPRATAWRAPCVSVPSCTREIVDYLGVIFGGRVTNKKAYRRRHRKSYVWVLRHDAALRFLTGVLPYLREPEKLRRTKMLVREHKSLTRRNGRYSDTELKLKREFEQRFFRYTRMKL